MSARKGLSLFGAFCGTLGGIAFWINCHFEYHEALAGIGGIFAIVHLIDYAVAEACDGFKRERGA